MTRRAPRAARMMAPFGAWIYLDRAGPNGLGGWIALPQALKASSIEIVVGGVRVRAPLRPDAEPIEGRALYRFTCALPLAERNLVTLRFGERSVSLFTVHRGQRAAPLFAPAPFQAAQSAAPSPVRGRTLVVLAPIDWSFRRQRSQQLTAALAAHFDATLYLGPASLQLSGEAFPADGGAVRLPLLGTAPDCDFSERALADAEAEATVAALQTHIGDGADVLVQFPSWQAVARRLSGARIIYDCIDFHAALPHVTAPLAESERALAHNAALCLATSGPLLEHVRALGANQALLSPNATPAPQLKAWPMRRSASVLYVGAVESWFDFALIEALARAMPETAIEIIGQCGVELPRGLPRNVVFLGERSHAHASKAMMQARVGIIPFKRDALVGAVNPVKAYEYLAAGLPVVMTPMGGDELATAPGVSTVDAADAFVAAVKAAYTTADEDRRSYAAWAETQTWDARARQIVERLAEL